MKRHRSLTHSAFTPNTRAVPSFSGFFFESHHQCVQIIFTRQPDCASIDQNRDNQTVFTSVGSLFPTMSATKIYYASSRPVHCMENRCVTSLSEKDTVRYQIFIEKKLSEEPKARSVSCHNRGHTYPVDALLFHRCRPCCMFQDGEGTDHL